MYNSKNGSYEIAGSDVCQTCGNVKMSYDGTQSTKKLNILFAALGWLFAAISLLFLPIIFGAAAFFLGLLTYYERNKVHGAFLMTFATIGLVLGSLFSFFVAGTMFF